MSKTARALGLVAAAILAASCPPGPLAAGAEAPVTGNTAFALDLYAKLKAKPGNLFFSPYSISTALAMTYVGARGNTEAQMAKVLHFGVGQDKLHGLFKALDEKLNARGRKRGYQLSVASSLWAQQGYKLLDSFVEVVDANYGGGLRQVDFKGATEACRQRINRWVEKRTNDKINDLIPKGILIPDTRLALVNAIYFKGDWARAFKKSRTKDGPFTRADGTKVTAPLMRQTARFGYLATPGFQALEMPYIGRDVSMVIFLPRKPDGLPAFEKSLRLEKLDGWLRRLRSRREVDATVPRFKMTWGAGLKDVLSALGMSDAFVYGTANFAGINGKEYDLFIYAVIHKAFVEVNEKGTEAAAATAVLMTDAAAPAPPPVFRANRPFLFLIRHKPTGSILFIGRVANPKG